MTRRDFLLRALTLSVAWIAGLKSLDLRRILRGLPLPREEWPLGLADLLQSTQLYGLSRSTYTNWSTA